MTISLLCACSVVVVCLFYMKRVDSKRVVEIGNVQEGWEGNTEEKKNTQWTDSNDLQEKKNRLNNRREDDTKEGNSEE